MSEATDMPVACECPPQAGSATCVLRPPPKHGLCPSCGEQGKAVESITLKALLAVPLTQLQATGYLFCSTVSCPVVYFTADGQSWFAEESLRERVHQKHPEEDDVFVCYCFRHTPGSIKAELMSTGRISVIEAITAGIRAEKCACDIRNPQGSCCLGNVRAVADRLTTATGTTESHV